jgi:hypothetical protein
MLPAAALGPVFQAPGKQPPVPSGPPGVFAASPWHADVDDPTRTE